MEPSASEPTDAPAEHTNETPHALVMKGGGIKGLAYVGALEVLQDKYHFNWYIGTSAGAIAAVLLCAGFNTYELKEILKNKNFGDFFDAKWYQRPLNLLFYKGLHKADKLTDWLDKLIAKKLVLKTRPKLSDLPGRVTVYATQRLHDALEYDPETHDVYASFAARCSMSIPYLFTPQADQGFFAFDGGVRHNYPLDVLLDKHAGTPFISFYLGPEVYEPVKETTVLGSLLSIITEAAEAETIEKYRKHTVIIDPRPIGTLDFTLSEDEKELLLQAGRVGALAHLAPDTERLAEARVALDRLRQTVQFARDRKAARRKRRLRLVSAIAVCLGAAGGWWIWQGPKKNSTGAPQGLDGATATQPMPSASTRSANKAEPEQKTADSHSEKEHQLVAQLDAAVAQSLKDTGVTPAFAPLETALASVRNYDVESSIEVMERLSSINGWLAFFCDVTSSFSRAVQHNNNAYHYLKLIYQKSPSFVLKPPPEASAGGLIKSGPIGAAIFQNRFFRAFFVYAERKSALDPTMRRQLNDDLALGDEALQKSDVEGLDAGYLWLNSCLSHWLNGDRDGAKKALAQAITQVGAPGRPDLESADRREFFKHYYQYVAALDAMTGESESAIQAVNEVKSFWPHDKNKKNGRLGYIYLLIARGARLPDTVQTALVSSKEYLENGDKCMACEYSLACVLSKLCEMSKGADRDSTLKQAKDYFLSAIRQIAACPEEPDIARVRTDPFLRALVSLPDIELTLKNFKWEPPADPQPSAYGELWHLSFPVKRTALSLPHERTVKELCLEHTRRPEGRPRTRARLRSTRLNTEKYMQVREMPDARHREFKAH